ncbi:MAG: cupin domain-containing protein [Nanoarchaeota archaeon]
MNSIKDIIEYPREGILSKSIFKEDGLDVTLFCMAAGTKISSHTSTKKGFVYVLEGKGNFYLGARDIEMKSNIFIPMKENAIHSLKVEKDTSFILVLI